jgi:hypothetical protein
VVSDSESEDEKPTKLRQTKEVPKEETKEPKEDKKSVVVSNKKMDPSSVPPKPTKIAVAPKDSKDFFFKMTFTHGPLLTKFLEPVAKSVKKIRFALCKTPDFTGFKMEAHDAFFTLANQSRFECDVEVGKGIHGGLMSDAEINKYIFCVRSKSFMDALSASALKETTLSIARYHETSDQITFESINNENDVRTV